MEREDLEKTVLQPTLLRHMLLQPLPSSHKMVTAETVTASMTGARDLSVVDGGRFVLVAKKGAVECWDFGPPCSSFVGTVPHLVAKTDLLGQYGACLQNQSSSKDGTVTVAFITEPDNE